jgi:hypothetical protein
MDAANAIAIALTARALDHAAGLFNTPLADIVTLESLVNWERDLSALGEVIKRERLKMGRRRILSVSWAQVVLQAEAARDVPDDPFGYGVFVRYDHDERHWRVHWVGDPDMPLDALPTDGGFSA